MTEIVVRLEALEDGFALRLSGGARGATTVPVCGSLSDRGVEITRSIEPVQRAPVHRPAIIATPAMNTGGKRISETFALITDPATGKYAHRNQFRDELHRALRYAEERWGDIEWTAVTRAHWIALLRRRLEELLAEGARGVRATEITVSRLITAIGWMRDSGLIPTTAAPWPRDWKQEIKKHWKGLKGTVRDPEPFRPRYTLPELQAIIRAADFDPRFWLLLWLGVELRLGQVARALRSDLALEGDADSFGTLVVHGSGKKGGTIVELTEGQRAEINRALGDGGYLHGCEQLYRDAATDYFLFPAGYCAGRVARARGDAEAILRLGDKIDYSRHVGSSWLRKTWRLAEKRAGVPHVKGRCAYGGRRLGVDVGDEADLSMSGLQALGGWSDPNMPLKVYREKGNRAGRREARSVRAKLRGEVALAASQAAPEPAIEQRVANDSFTGRAAAPHAQGLSADRAAKANGAAPAGGAA